MPDTPNMPVRPPSPAVPKTDGFGSPDRELASERGLADSSSNAASVRPPSLQDTLDEFETILRERHPEEITSDPKRFRDTVVTGIMRRFRLTPGRPRVEHLNKAETLRAKGHKLDHICRIITPEYAYWHPYRRLAYRNSIFAGLRQRDKRRKKSSRETITS